MKLKAIHLIILSTIFALLACHFNKSKPPTGQVVARVGNREITLRELQVELAGTAPAKTSAAAKQNERAALKYVIERVILANAARDQGLDKDPSYLILAQRATDTLLAQQLMAKIASNVPAPTNEEAEQFELANPNLFAERKIFHVDQIRMAKASDGGIVSNLEPLKTLDEVAAFLTQNNIPFQRGTNTLDALQQGPVLANKIANLSSQDIFILASNSEIFINHIRDTETRPFTGQSATRYALSVLKSTHTQAAVQRGIANIIAKAHGAVQLNKNYPIAPAAVPRPKP